jgi:hypothetical protein
MQNNMEKPKGKQQMLFQTIMPFLPLNLLVPDILVSELFKEMKGNKVSSCS